MKAVWLHVLGDAFGSIVVVLSAGAMMLCMRYCTIQKYAEGVH